MAPDLSSCDETGGEAWSFASFSEAALIWGLGGEEFRGGWEEKSRGRGGVKGWCGWTHLGWALAAFLMVSISVRCDSRAGSRSSGT